MYTAEPVLPLAYADVMAAEEEDQNQKLSRLGADILRTEEDDDMDFNEPERSSDANRHLFRLSSKSMDFSDPRLSSQTIKLDTGLKDGPPKITPQITKDNF